MKSLIRGLVLRSLPSVFALAWLMTLPDNAAAQAVQHAVDHERSYIAVRTDKGGFLSAFGVGHKHGILATNWSADICFDPQNVPASSVVVSVSTASLRIDTSEARKRAGLDPEGPSANDMQKIQEKMLASQYLAAEEHADIRFRSNSIRMKSEREFLLSGSLLIRGKPQTVSLPVSFEPLDGGRYHFSARFPIEQTSYGIKPESIGGVVKVKDQVMIYLDVYTSSTSKACP